MKRLATAAAALLLCAAAPLGAGAQPLWDPAEFLDESTLDVVVLDDWHVDTVNGLTRQKLVDIHVAEWWPGFEYRVRVRYIVPLGGPATGIHLTGGHSANSLLSDFRVAGFNAELIVRTVCSNRSYVRSIWVWIFIGRDLISRRRGFVLNLGRQCIVSRVVQRHA